MKARYSPLEQFERVGDSRQLVVMVVVSMVRGGCRRYKVSGTGVDSSPRRPSRVSLVEREMSEGLADRLYQATGLRYGEKRYGVVKSRGQAILGANRLGIVSYAESRTSQLVVTRLRSTVVWLWKRVIGRKLHGVSLAGRLRPAGTPRMRLPLLVPLELLGFRITLVSLAVRLFANRMAGHVLLKVIGGFGWSRLIGRDRLGRVPRVALRLLIGLETGVALIQAYVFSLLTCLYLGDMVRGGH